MLTYGITRDRPVRPRKLRFGILSAEEVRKMSVCQITETTLYYRGLPASGGLLDPLLGSVDRRHLCASCMRDARTCQGHNGHIELSYPMYHVGFVDTVLKVLRCTCFCCSRVSLTEEERAQWISAPEDRRNRLGAIHTLLRSRKTCPHCGMTRPTFTRVGLSIRCDWPSEMEWGGEEERAYCTAPFTAREALSILRYITDDDARLLGFDPESHPRAMILQAMSVPPPCTRPAIYSSEGSRSRGQNDLTVRLLEILKRSQEVHAALDGQHWKDVPPEAFTPDTLERIAKLQYEVYALVNSNLRIPRPGGTHSRSSTTNQKSLSDRLKGKEGRLRGNLMGKRVDMSARAVITPDAYFDSDRVGIPYDIAKRLTVPVTTNSANIRILTERVRRGADDIRGAQTIVGMDGTVTHLSTCRDRDSLVLRPGDVVERHLADEDVVVFNRQPSLHKHGMSCHRVRLMPGHTFRVSLVVTGQYNADFDGDEMNVHVPQSAAARAECAMLMAVGQNIIGSQSRPVMGIVQDSCLGVHLLTQPDTLFDHAHACRIVGALRHAPRALPAPAVAFYANGVATHRWWTGKQIFSMLFPHNFYHEPEGDVFAKVEEWEDAKLPVVVRGGKLLCGILRKAQVGSGSGSFIDVLTRDHGNVACMRFFGDCQRMTHAFLLQRDHHVGVKDVMLSKEGQERVRERLAKASNLCEEIQKEVLDAPVEVAVKAERAILRILSKSLMQTGGIVSECLDESNAIRRMVTAGSKGSVINLGQICAALGQQSLEGARIVAEKGDRTLPCFAPHDLSLASRGMVLNSFALGLSPTEMFYHGVGGREGLVDTAVKTSQSGYLQRRMNKSMEDARVRGDGTVRNASDEVLNFRWGSDGLHPARLERAKLNLLSESEDSIRARMTPAEAALALEARAQVLRIKMHTLITDFDTRVLLPFHPSRVRNRIARERAADPASRIDPADAEHRVLAFAKSTSPAIAAAALDILCASRAVAMDREAHERLFRDLEARLAAASAVVGESVGCLAAQSVGEPCTQMTLNTFHSAGVADKNVTLGIPRFKECVDASKYPKTPCVTLRLLQPYASSKEFAEYVASTLPLTRLGDVVAKSSIVYDPDPRKTVVEEDEWIVATEGVLTPESETTTTARYVMRFELQQEKMRMRKLTPPILRHMLRERLQERANVISSEANAVDWVVRIRFARVADMASLGSLTGDQEAIICQRAANVLLDTVVISGHREVSASNAGTSIRIDHKDGIPSSRDEHVVHAYGSFLMDAAALECIDWSRCTSNDIWETYHNLGVEAAAHVLFDQIRSVVSFDGTYIDDKHMLMLVDTMCRSGSLMPLNRHGINRTDVSPLMRASFEETIDVLCDAAMFSTTENARGCTTSIMTGQLAEFGSGSVKVLFRDDSTPDSYKPPRRVMRSTCRSHTVMKVPQVLEYVFGEARPTGTRPLSPVEDENGAQSVRRVRFRPSSPV